MPASYTNRKGVIYYLCEGKTAAGKAHYYFTSQDQGKRLEEIPEGYTIRENVNGQVSLRASKHS